MKKNKDSIWARDIFSGLSLGSRIGTRKATHAQIAPLCRQLSFMLKGGVSLQESLLISAKNQSKGSSLKTSLEDSLDGIMGGESLSNSLKATGFFPRFMISMCQIGEISDNLPKVMALLADYYEQSARNREEIRSALLYPVIVAVLMLAMVFAAVLFVLPNYALMFAASDVQLPIPTRVLLSLGNILMNEWWIAAPVIAALIILPIAVVRTSEGKAIFDSLLLRIPIYRQLVSLQIIQAMALLLQSGQNLADSAITVSDIVSNVKVSRDLKKVAAGLQEGSALGGLLEDITYIDRVAIGMARVGEQTGNIAETFDHANIYSREQFSQTSKRLNKLVEPVIILILGLVLGFVMLSIMLPTFSMVDLVQ